MHPQLACPCRGLPPHFHVEETLWIATSENNHISGRVDRLGRVTLAKGRCSWRFSRFVARVSWQCSRSHLGIKKNSLTIMSQYYKGGEAIPALRKAMTVRLLIILICPFTRTATLEKLSPWKLSMRLKSHFPYFRETAPYFLKTLLQNDTIVELLYQSFYQNEFLTIGDRDTNAVPFWTSTFQYLLLKYKWKRHITGNMWAWESNTHELHMESLSVGKHNDHVLLWT